jgi:integrase
VASYRKTQYGWRAEVFRSGVRRSESGFRTKAAAVAWASQVEADILAGKRGEIPNLTVAALLTRYKKEVSKHKKGKRWEEIRLDALQGSKLASVRLRLLDTPHVSKWQEERLEAVSGASVRRERNLLNNVFNIAVKEWKWLSRNPFIGVRRPKDGKPRKRIVTPDEVERLTAEDGELTKAIIAALETGMRAGEIPRARISGKVAFLADTKNGEVREVPLSDKAIESFKGGINLTAGSISALFARRCKALGIKGLTFHDLRASSATRLSKVLNPLQLARMFGWKDLKQAMTYYREATEDIAKLL